MSFSTKALLKIKIIAAAREFSRGAQPGTAANNSKPSAEAEKPVPAKQEIREMSPRNCTRRSAEIIKEEVRRAETTHQRALDLGASPAERLFVTCSAMQVQIIRDCIGSGGDAVGGGCAPRRRCADSQKKVSTPRPPPLGPFSPRIILLTDCIVTVYDVYHNMLLELL